MRNFTPFCHHFNGYWFKTLVEHRKLEFSGVYNKLDYTAKIIFPNYEQQISDYYSDIILGNLKQFSTHCDIPFTFTHFGIEIRFYQAAELILHDDQFLLDEGLRQLISAGGAVIIKNAYMNDQHRDMGHRNRFPHLNFHVDRTANQPTHYSMYSRNPFDEEQQHPRTSSTLFIPGIVGHLQAIKEGIVQKDDRGMKGTYTLFTNEKPDDLMQKIILEHAWNEPMGVGEISMLNNLNLLHASYYRNPAIKGYKIGVRYLA